MIQRRHQLPKRLWRYGRPGNPFGPLSARQQWMMARSRDRYANRPDADIPSMDIMRGEIGRWNGMRIIQNAG